MKISINETLREDELRSILAKLESDQDKESFGLVCKRWLHLQSSERKKLCDPAGPHMLRRGSPELAATKTPSLSPCLSSPRNQQPQRPTALPSPVANPPPPPPPPSPCSVANEKTAAALNLSLKQKS